MCREGVVRLSTPVLIDWAALLLDRASFSPPHAWRVQSLNYSAQAGAAQLGTLVDKDKEEGRGGKGPEGEGKERQTENVSNDCDLVLFK